MPADLDQLAACARRIRRYALRMGEVQGQGYVGQALGYADVLAVAYGHALNLRPDDPHWEGRDRFLLSHGHYAIAHYAALIEAGIIPESELETYGSDDSRLPMSGMATYTPGMEISGGSLGHGLAVATGMALGLRHRGNPARVFNLLSDGELDEGSTWEAALQAAFDDVIASGFNSTQPGGFEDALAASFEKVMLARFDDAVGAGGFDDGRTSQQTNLEVRE